MLSNRQVDFETHSVRLRKELDHAPAPRELGDVTYRQDACLVERRQNLFESTLLRGADEQDAATRGVLRFRDARNHYLLAVDALTRDGRIEGRAERIPAEHANAEVLAGSANFSGPFNESAKVIQVGRLDLILRGV